MYHCNGRWLFHFNSYGIAPNRSTSKSKVLSRVKKIVERGGVKRVGVLAVDRVEKSVRKQRMVRTRTAEAELVVS